MAYVNPNPDVVNPLDTESISNGASRIRALAASVLERFQTFFDTSVSPWEFKNEVVPSDAVETQVILNLPNANPTAPKILKAALAVVRISSGAVAANGGNITKVITVDPSVPLGIPAGGIAIAPPVLIQAILSSGTVSWNGFLTVVVVAVDGVTHEITVQITNLHPTDAIDFATNPLDVQVAVFV